MTDAICLDHRFSTTRLLTAIKPSEISETNTLKSIGGLRTKGYCKKSDDKKPLISIITVVYNGEKYLEETILSILNQTYDNVEYIIIDGKSTDTTLEIVKKYEDKIDYWISESDTGIYDAMNKGISLSSNDTHLWFINAGDRIYSNDVIEQIYKSGKYDVYYGETALVNNQYQIVNTLTVPHTLTWNDMYQGMIISHQSIIIHKKL
ncbi:MAG: glycosyltransferase, partial [Sulfuricurvum sp.]|nr:glycosyltransferase [Sulfuricurvum sp.]